MCLIRPNQGILHQIKQLEGKTTIIVDRIEIEKDCDVILYWFDPSDDVLLKMLDLQNKIKPDGRIWVIIPNKEAAKKKKMAINWENIQEEILKTHLVDNKILSISEEEYGTQFVIRRQYRPIRE